MFSKKLTYGNIFRSIWRSGRIKTVPIYWTHWFLPILKDNSCGYEQPYSFNSSFESISVTLTVCISDTYMQMVAKWALQSASIHWESMCYYFWHKLNAHEVYTEPLNTRVGKLFLWGDQICILHGAHPIDMISHWPTNGYLEVVFQNVFQSEHWEQYWYYFNHTEEIILDTCYRDCVFEKW